MVALSKLLAAIFWIVIGFFIWVPMLFRALVAETFVRFLSAFKSVDIGYWENERDIVYHMYRDGLNKILIGTKLTNEFDSNLQLGDIAALLIKELILSVVFWIVFIAIVRNIVF